MLRERIFSHISGTCCRMGKETLSWKDLHSRASALAAELFGSREPVLIYGEKSPEYVIAIVGCLWAGRPYIPAGKHIPALRIRTMLTEADIKTAVVVSPLPEELMAGMICFSVPQQGNGEFSLPPVLNEDIAYILFTSGSTGVPKGVMVTYLNLENFIEWFTSRPAIAALYPHAVLNQAQFSFDLSVADLYYTLYIGCTLELLQEGIPASAGASRAELAIMTPSYADCCLLDECFAARALPCLQTIFFCGEPLRGSTVRRLWQRFPGLRIINAYGPTEATCAISSAEITPDLAAQEVLPIGRESGEAVDITLSAENLICLQGTSVAAGYLNGACFEGRFLTGDLGHFEKEYLWYDGRCDDQIKYKGYRIEPVEIEAALTAQPNVQQAVVLPRYDRLGRIVALRALVTIDGTTDEETLREALRHTLPDYMIPRQIIVCDKLPLTVNGKTDRKKAALLP